MFMDKYGIEYKFDEEEDAIMEEWHVEEAPFPDIPAEAPGILTQYKNLINGDDVIEDEPVLGMAKSKQCWRRKSQGWSSTPW